MDIEAVIDEHGWALQSVLGDGPGTAPFTYSIGLLDRVPELHDRVGVGDGAPRQRSAVAAAALEQPDVVQIELTGVPPHPVRAHEPAPCCALATGVKLGPDGHGYSTCMTEGRGLTTHSGRRGEGR